MEYERRMMELRSSGRRPDLDMFVSCEANAIQAAVGLKQTTRQGVAISSEALLRRLDRLAVRLGFTHRDELIVWYELNARGQDVVDIWRKRLEPRFRRTDRTARILDMLERLAALTCEGKTNRVTMLADELGVNPRTVSRPLIAFAQKVRIAYSIDWLVILYMMHRELNITSPSETESE